MEREVKPAIAGAALTTAAVAAVAQWLPAWVCLGGASAAWLAVVPAAARAKAWLVILVAVLVRAALWSSGLATDDLHRFVWEGRIQQHGFSPYALAPDDPRLAHLRDASWDGINHPEHATIYPPLAQVVFRAAAALGLRGRGFRLLFALLDVAAILALIGWLRAARRPPGWALIYAWCPIPAIASTMGHYEPLALLPLAAAGWAWTSQRFVLAPALLALAAMAKLFAVLLLPWMLVRKPRQALLGFVPVSLLLVLPYLPDGHLVGPLLHFARAFTFNGSLFDLLDAVSGGYGRGLAGLLLGAWIVQILRARLPLPTAAWLSLTGFLLLSPTVHYWYLCWPLLPLAVAGPGRVAAPFLAWCASVAALYPTYQATYRGGPFVEYPAATAIEYAVPALLAAGLAIRCRRLRPGRAGPAPRAPSRRSRLQEPSRRNPG